MKTTTPKEDPSLFQLPRRRLAAGNGNGSADDEPLESQGELPQPGATQPEPPALPELEAEEETEYEAETRKPNKKRRLLWLMAAAAIFIGVPVGYMMYHNAVHFESTDDAFVEGHVVQISPRISGHVQKVYVDDNQVVEAGALLFELDPQQYQAQADAAQAQLKVAQANAQQASIAVKVTSVTAVSDKQQAEAAYQASLAQVASGKAQVETTGKKLEEANAAVETARAKAQQAHSAVVAAKSEADRLTSDALRTQKLYETHTVAREDYEHAMAQARSADAQLQAAVDSQSAAEAGISQAIAALRATSDTVHQFEAQVKAAEASAQEAKAKLAAADIAKEKLQTAQAELETARANVKVAQANLDEAKLNLEYTKVRAVSAGKVTRKIVEPGNYLAPGQTVMALVKPDVWVVANFKETQLKFMNPGDKAEVEVDMTGRTKYSAHVESIQAGTGARFSLLPPENATGNFVKVVQRVPVKLVFDEPVDQLSRLTPGLSVKPKVRIQ